MNVSFKYPGSDTLILSEINFSVFQGEFCVIVGANGAGKTTLTSLLCRLYDVSTGEIFYNGVNIKNIEFRNYREQIGIVFQDYKYYDFSIAENIATDEYNDSPEILTRINNALKVVGLQQKVDGMPNGINTRLGNTMNDDGVLLSGGEIQKLAIARVLFKDNPVVILDEPSSALDAFAEDEFITTACNAFKDKIVFYISHRLSVAKYADKVMFLNNNKIEGFMNHDKLIQVNESYANMYLAQSRHYSGV